LTNSIRNSYSRCIISNTYIKPALEKLIVVNICTLVNICTPGRGGRELAVTASHDYINQPLKK